MNNLTFIFLRNRKKVLESNLSYAQEFFYGATLFEDDMYNIKIIEQDEQQSNKLLNLFDRFNKRFFNIPSNSEKFLNKNNFQIMLNSDHIFFVNETVGYSLIFFLIYGFVRSMKMLSITSSNNHLIDSFPNHSSVLSITTNFTKDINVPENYYEEAYLAYSQEVDNSSQKRISHIMIDKSNYDNEEEALQAISILQEKILNGDDFALIAQNYSEDLLTKDSGGDLDYFSADLFPMEFETEVNNLNLNETSNVINLESTIHILKITEVFQEELLSFEDKKVSLEAELIEAESLSHDEITLRLSIELINQMNGLENSLSAYCVNVLSTPWSEVFKQMDAFVQKIQPFADLIDHVTPYAQSYAPPWKTKIEKFSEE